MPLPPWHYGPPAPWVDLNTIPPACWEDRVEAFVISLWLEPRAWQCQEGWDACCGATQPRVEEARSAFSVTP
jgi:hypothetical protein